MTGKEFKNIRKLRLKWTQAACAGAMGSSLRTIQGIEAMGDGIIKGVYGVCIHLLAERSEAAVAAIGQALDARLEREYPHGITSDIDRDRED